MWLPQKNIDAIPVCPPIPYWRFALIQCLECHWPLRSEPIFLPLHLSLFYLKTERKSLFQINRYPNCNNVVDPEISFPNFYDENLLKRFLIPLHLKPPKLYSHPLNV